MATDYAVSALCVSGQSLASTRRQNMGIRTNTTARADRANKEEREINELGHPKEKAIDDIVREMTLETEEKQTNQIFEAQRLQMEKRKRKSILRITDELIQKSEKEIHDLLKQKIALEIEQAQTGQQIEDKRLNIKEPQEAKDRKVDEVRRK